MHTYDLATIAARAQSTRRSSGVLVVAIDGPSGSGKSRLAGRIGRALGTHTTLRMDHVVPGWDGLERSVELIRRPLAQLRDGAATSYQLWDWQRDDWGQRLTRPAVANVVLEGCGSGALALSDLVDFLVWVDAPEQVRHTRAIARDGEIYSEHWARWAAQEAAHYESNHTRERADLILDGRRPVR